MESHRIAIVSDTHGLLRAEVESQLKGCEAAFHGGDIGGPDILRRMEDICPVHAVLGNTDRNLTGQMPEELETELYGFRIYMAHDRKQMRQKPEEYDIVIYGHSHKYEEISRGRTLYLNPGSCGPRRFRLPVTMMLLTLFPEGHRIETERIDCLSGAPIAGGAYPPDAASGLSRQDMYELVRKIMREVDRGKAVPDIVARTGVDRETAEGICRMYLTHPGVDVDGIMDRMERREHGY